MLVSTQVELNEPGEWRSLLQSAGLVLGRQVPGGGMRLCERRCGDRWVTDLVLLSCTEMNGNIGKLPPGFVKGEIARSLARMIPSTLMRVRPCRLEPDNPSVYRVAAQAHRRAAQGAGGC